MSNIETVNALFSAIERDRADEVEALLSTEVLFRSFRGPTLRSQAAVGDWHREFLRDYADCVYSGVEFVEQEDRAAVRATVSAKGFDWREFTQRMVEVFEFEDGVIKARRQYAMMHNVEFGKPETAALKNVDEYPGGKPEVALDLANGFFTSILAGDAEAAAGRLDPKAALVDGVFGTAIGPENVVAILSEMPVPAFGGWRIASTIAGPKAALVELEFAPGRPRAAHWVRVVEDRVVLVESYWMLREIGVRSDAGNNPRHAKQVILPI
ncbi:MAG TPA: nuclear transport factor 2 family protein [Dehalococcoidia bacterium]|nr:nuclear transport factor 2 family protein [Dehalococcoidia bacterium]